jgi:peptide/nickel transport system permease protein
MLEILQENLLVQNSLAAMVLLATLTFMFATWRSRRGREVWLGVLRRKSSALSFVVIMVFMTIGLLDSFLWRDAMHDASGQVQLNQQGEPVLESRPLSILDRLCTTMRTQVEKTYSAPFASHQFSKDLVSDEQGKKVWLSQPLLYPQSHWLGTDIVGRDVLFMSLKSIRTALIIGLFTTLISVPIALLLGILAGYFGRRTDVLIQFLYSTIGSVPFVLIAAAYILLYGASIFNLCVIMGLTGWTSLCRLLRGEVLKCRELDYVQGARALGAGSWRIMWRYIIPNVFHLVIITSVLEFSGLVLSESVLSYLKIGVGQGTYSWGNMINQANLELSREPIIWWNLLGAFGFMMALILPVNIFGDALRDALDPKLKGRA